MIVTTLVDVIVSHNNKGYYKEKGYNVTPGKTLSVSLDDIPESAAVTVQRKCDVCGHISEIKSYRKIRNQGKLCKKCARKNYGRELFGAFKK